MSISSSHGPSSADFSFFPDEEENPTASLNQERTLKGQVCSFVDQVGYKIYSIYFNRPPIIPLEFAEAHYEVTKKKFFAKKPISYEEARERVLSYTQDNIGTWGPDLEIKNVDLYADPEFRKEKVKAYADSLLKGRYPRNRDEEFWLVMSFCEEELHDLYKKEPKYLKSSIPAHLWMLKGHNKPILAKHKKEWDQLSPSEKAEKIFGKRRKYEIAVGVSTIAAWYLSAFTSLATVASGLGSAISGALVGYSLEEIIGSKRAIKDEASSPKYIFWSNQKYKKTIFPALSRYEKPTLWSNIPLECPITLDWMLKPVQAEDGHIYEKAAILAHLAAWRKRLQEKKAERLRFGMGPIPPQEMQELLQARSPLRNGNITIAGLKECPDYYEIIFEKLKRTYNAKVSEKQSIAADAENIPQPFTEEVSKVMRFYEKTQRERSITEADVHTDLLKSPTLSDKEIKKANEFLNAASALPRLLKKVI